MLPLPVQVAAAVVCIESVRRVPIVFFQQQGGPPGPPLLDEHGRPLTDDYVPFRANPTGIQPILLAVLLCEGVPWALRGLGLSFGALGGALGGPIYYTCYWAIVFGFTFLDVEDTPQEVADYMVKAPPLPSPHPLQISPNALCPPPADRFSSSASPCSALCSRALSALGWACAGQAGGSGRPSTAGEAAAA